VTTQHDRPILVVDDDPKIVRLVRTYLERAGHRVVEATDGSTALLAIERENPALVVLDLMLPGIDGLTILETVRRRGDTPVVILSARGTTSDRIEGLGLGADDYLPKPFSPAELVVRVGRVLARAGASRPAVDLPLLVYGGLTVDRARHLVEVDGRPVLLTSTELRLLVALLEADGRVLTRDQLLDAVYGADAESVLDRTIDVLVGRVRHRLGDTTGSPRFIETVRGTGYRAAARAGRASPASVA
jgi:two-component system phosphate regulon response regulator PhoB